MQTFHCPDCQPRRPAPGRRALLAVAGATLACTAAGLPPLAAPARAATGARTSLTAEQALERLKEGNRSYVSSGPLHQEEIGRERRLAIAQSQTPFCVMIGCSDSRVPPELLFGRGLGELFIVRNAGNTEGHTSLGSVEYAVAALGVPLVVVLGHERCGAVAAAIDVVERNAVLPGVISEVVEPIIPAVLKARSDGHSGTALLDQAVEENVRRVVARLQTASTIISEPQRAGRLKVVGARYDLDNGEVTFFN
ncbi:carbonic anhydrase [Roseomonas sp. E05]|uniref:carbonic anhydrase n=1 Tax=Roseomonas sp. E05 TaxID=3046310 RepID=UPI0024BB5CEA|nr:carbonic anhydrase [Roseomonas sp. E05]MDJ0387069.1 carbonic anhydrase [Roseomonas sp. E05]